MEVRMRRAARPCVVILVMALLTACTAGPAKPTSGTKKAATTKNPAAAKKASKPQPKITYETTEVAEQIAFTEQHTSDPNLNQGTSQVRQEGANGARTKFYRITLVDGIETTRSLEREEVTVEPQPRIVADGTKVPQPPPSSETVYITRTGARYHRAHPTGCHSYLSQSKIPISRSQAEAQGYTPCQCASCGW